MEIWDDEGDELTTSKTHEEREWTRISETFHNDGYREGITTGKESALQQGFDDGFNDIGVPIGKEIGTLTGIVTGLLHFVNSPSSGIDGQILPTIKAEVEQILNVLNHVWLEDIIPPDPLAEEHEKVHSGEGEQKMVDNQSSGQMQDGMDDISSAFQSLGTTDSKARKAQRREEALKNLHNTKDRLARVLEGIGIQIPVV